MNYQTKTNQKFALIKLGEYEHMRQLYEEGHLFFNTFKLFKEMDKAADGRGDENEYVSAHYAGEKISYIPIDAIPLDDPNKKFTANGGTDLKAVTLDFGNDKRFTHLYSLSSIDINWALQHDLIIDEKNFAPKKDYAVFIYNFDEFVNRVENKIKELPDYDYEFKPIEYVDKDTYFGEMGAFRKFNDYAYQSEYRIANYFKGDATQPKSLYIGSLEGIATKPLNKFEFYNIMLNFKCQDLEGNSKIVQITNKKVLDKLVATV